MPHPDRARTKRRDLLRFKHGDSEQLSPARCRNMTNYRYLFKTARSRQTNQPFRKQQISEIRLSQPVKEPLAELLVATNIMPLKFDGDIACSARQSTMNLALL